jgi:hypothetical protein
MGQHSPFFNNGIIKIRNEKFNLMDDISSKNQ